MSDMVPEIDKLRKLLDKAGIPYKNRVQLAEDDEDIYVKMYGEAGKYTRKKALSRGNLTLSGSAGASEPWPGL